MAPEERRATGSDDRKARRDRLRARARRALADQIGRWAELLPPADHALFKAVFEDGRTAREIARLLGGPERTVRRRVARLVARVSSARFMFVARHMRGWTPTRRRVAEAVVLHGRSYRGAARDLHLTVYAVRLHMQAVELMFDSVRRAA